MNNNNSNAVTVSTTSSNNFWYNNSLFVAQFIFSIFGVAFSAGMLISGADTNVYLPVLTAITFMWVPSPINHKVPDLVLPSGIPQLRELIQRNGGLDDINNLANLSA
jgi:hypothetical protein